MNHCDNCCIWSAEGERFRCTRCGISRPKPIRRVCQASKEPVSLHRQSRLLAPWRYALALIRWAWAGFPTREEREYQRVYAICSGCEQWDKEAEKCNHCGCGGKADGPVWRNKLKMTTETCPLKKW